MRRVRRDTNDGGQDRWLVSYADFITLLFAFFVVMYSISSVNEGKYKVLSETLEGVFNTRPKSVEPIQVGELTYRTEHERGADALHPLVARHDPVLEKPKQDVDDDQLEEIAGEFAETFEDLIYEDKVSIRVLDHWVEITLKDKAVFDSAGVIPTDQAFPIIQKLGRLLKTRRNGVLIEGHTDNFRINTDAYPSNWELSVARAATFLRLLSIEGVPENNMAAIGYGEYRPLVRNDTPKGRSENRRIVVLISRFGDLRRSLLN